MSSFTISYMHIYILITLTPLSLSTTPILVKPFLPTKPVPIFTSFVLLCVTMDSGHTRAWWAQPWVHTEDKVSPSLESIRSQQFSRDT